MYFQNSGLGQYICEKTFLHVNSYLAVQRPVNIWSKAFSHVLSKLFNETLSLLEVIFLDLKFSSELTCVISNQCSRNVFQSNRVSFTRTVDVPKRCVQLHVQNTGLDAVVPSCLCRCSETPSPKSAQQNILSASYCCT